MRLNCESGNALGTAVYLRAKAVTKLSTGALRGPCLPQCEQDTPERRDHRQDAAGHS